MIAVAVASTAVLVMTVAWVQRPGDHAATADTARHGGSPSSSASRAIAQQRQAATTIDAENCDQVRSRFVPRSVSIPGVVRRATVVAPPRDANGIPGTPPLTSAGSWQLAWDREQGVLPGQDRGNVIVNAHTWPDGTAIGNQMLAELRRGDRVVVVGAAGQRLCYRISEKVEVPAGTLMPRYYAKKGPAQLAILVCSGRRLGPGVWTKRTVWFATPIALPG